MNDLYQYNYASINPAFAGIEGTKMSFTGSSFRAKKPIETNDVFRVPLTAVMNFETLIKKINSGLAFTAVVEQTPRDNFNPGFSYVYTNLSYNYQFSINNGDKIIVGAKLGLYQVAYDFTLVTPIGADYGRSVRYSNTLVAGAGALYKSKKFFAGISADNIAHHELKANENFVYLGDVLVHYFIGTDYTLSDKFKTTHSLYAATSFGKGEDLWRVDINSSVVYANLVVAGLSLQFDERNTFPKMNAGIKIKDRAQIMTVLYSRERDVSKKFGGQLLLQFKLD